MLQLVRTVENFRFVFYNQFIINFEALQFNAFENKKNMNAAYRQQVFKDFF